MTKRHLVATILFVNLSKMASGRNLGVPNSAARYDDGGGLPDANDVATLVNEEWGVYLTYLHIIQTINPTIPLSDNFFPSSPNESALGSIPVHLPAPQSTSQTVGAGNLMWEPIAQPQQRRSRASSGASSGEHQFDRNGSPWCTQGPEQHLVHSVNAQPSHGVNESHAHGAYHQAPGPGVLASVGNGGRSSNNRAESQARLSGPGRTRPRSISDTTTSGGYYSSGHDYSGQLPQSHQREPFSPGAASSRAHHVTAGNHAHLSGHGPVPFFGPTSLHLPNPSDPGLGSQTYHPMAGVPSGIYHNLNQGNQGPGEPPSPSVQSSALTSASSSPGHSSQASYAASPQAGTPAAAAGHVTMDISISEADRHMGTGGVEYNLGPGHGHGMRMPCLSGPSQQQQQQPGISPLGNILPVGPPTRRGRQTRCGLSRHSSAPGMIPRPTGLVSIMPSPVPANYHNMSRSTTPGPNADSMYFPLQLGMPTSAQSSMHPHHAMEPYHADMAPTPTPEPALLPPSTPAPTPPPASATSTGGRGHGTSSGRRRERRTPQQIALSKQRRKEKCKEYSKRYRDRRKAEATSLRLSATSPSPPAATGPGATAQQTHSDTSAAADDAQFAVNYAGLALDGAQHATQGTPGTPGANGSTAMAAQVASDHESDSMSSDGSEAEDI